ncbi:MAG TPA: hypothetical protein VLM37_05770 [Fibrobacteraceae bacterium]|nr:hypothetical protein [Fibrobacteraceae bacterium]
MNLRSMSAILATIPFLSGCLTDGGDSNGGSSSTQSGDVSFSDEPASFTLSYVMDSIQINSSEGYYVSADAGCYDGMYSRNNDDTTYFSISSGTLNLLWNKDYSCYMRTFSGSSSDLEGTWTMDGYELNPDYAYASTSSYCTQSYLDTLNEEMDSAYFSYQYIYTSTTQAVAVTYRDFCWSDNMLEVFQNNADELDYSLTISADGCSKINFTSDEGTAVLSMQALSNKNQTITYEITYKGTTCSQVIPFGPIVSPSSCSTAWDAYAADTSNSEEFDYDNYKASQLAESELLSCAKAAGFSYADLIDY